MKQTFLILICLFFAAKLVAQEQGIRFFKGAWKEALAMAKKENKPIFVDCNADWCMPCKRLAANEFSQKSMGDFFNANFINVDMDMEKGDGPMVRKKFQIEFYPALILVNKDGYRIRQIDVAGDKSAGELIEWAKAGLAIRDTLTYEQQFGEGRSDTAFLRIFFRDLMEKRNAKAMRIALDELVHKKGYQVLLENPCFEIIAVQELHSVIATYFFEHNKVFINKFGKDRVAAIISRMWNTANLMEEFYGPGPMRQYKPEAYAQFIEMLERFNIPSAEFIKGEVDAFIAARYGNQQKVMDICEEMLKNAKPWQYHDVAKLANEYLKGDKRLTAAKWARKAIDQNHNRFYRLECERFYDELLHRANASKNPNNPFEMIIDL